MNWNTITNQDAEISQPINYYNDVYHPEYGYQYEQAYTGQNFAEVPRYVKSYGIDDYEGPGVNTFPDQDIEQDFQSSWKETTQPRNEYDEAQEHYEDESYYEDENHSENDPFQQNRYYIPNQQPMHSYYNFYLAPYNRGPENGFYMDHSM